MLNNYEVKDDNAYLFICAQLKEREKEFIDNQKLERMINATDVNDFIKILQDTYYSKYIQYIEKTKKFEKVMFDEMETNIEFMRRNLTGNHQILKEFYLLEIDLHNIKLIMKAIETDNDFKELFIPINCSYEDLKESYISSKPKNLDKETEELLEYVFILNENEKNIRIKELKLERFYLNKIYNAIEQANSEILINLIKHRIDMFNIKNIYRVKYANEDFPYELFLYDNGFLSIEELMKFEKESIDYFVQWAEKTEYIKMIFQGTHLFNNENTFSAFEKNEDEFILKFFEVNRYSVANIEKVIEFILRKRIELKNLNIIFSGILYSIDKQKIKNRIAFI